MSALPLDFKEDIQNIDLEFEAVENDNITFNENSLSLDLEFEETAADINTLFAEETQEMNMAFGETAYLTNDIPFATKSTAGKVIIGDNLLIDNGVVSVDVANEADKDNTKPITAAAVAVQLGNIEVILGTI